MQCFLVNLQSLVFFRLFLKNIQTPKKACESIKLSKSDILK